jgi:hypothetical protein
MKLYKNNLSLSQNNVRFQYKNVFQYPSTDIGQSSGAGDLKSHILVEHVAAPAPNPVLKGQ